MMHTTQENANFQPEVESKNAVDASTAQRVGGTLQSRNVRIHNRRTSVRLEPEMWRDLNEIAGIEKCSIHDLCGAVHDLKDPNMSFTAALRVFLMEYYRAAAQVSDQVSQVQRMLKDAISGRG
ncbi:MAG: ribbon-helix-helix domain-containing protein [Alphaproteobacteria bacterium]|nr:ribbon-helix-helix domain-containing protein [Alphaproteobacteria bacterium]